MNGMMAPPQGPQGGMISAPLTGPAQQGRSFDIVDLKQYFHIVIKRIWLVALCFVIALAVTVINLVREIPVYRSGTSLLLSRGLPLPERVLQREQELQGEYMDTQIRIVQSGLIISKARERLNRPADEIAQKLMRIQVASGGRSAILLISVDATDPNFASDFANAMAEAYLDFKAEERMETSQSTVVSLTQQANRIREELKKAEDRVLSYKKENSMIAVQQKGNIAAEILSGLSQRAAQLKTDRMILEAQRPLVSAGSEDSILQILLPASSPLANVQQPPLAISTNQAGNRGAELLIEREVVKKPHWLDLKREKANMESQLASLRTRFRDAHPDIQRMLQRIQDNERSTQAEVQFALKEYYSRLDAMQAMEQAVERAGSEWEDDALAVSRKLDEYDSLQREVGRMRGLYELIMNRIKEIDISIGIEPESIKQLERAMAPSSPQSPRKMQSIFMAALIGIGIGLGLVFGLEYIDDSIRYPEEVTRDLGLTFLGVIPSANWDPDDLKTHLLSNIDQKSGLAESYRNVRSALLFAAEHEKMRTLVVTSAVPKEGKTTTSLNLSVSLAQAGMRVLLVDGDLRRGELHKFFGIEGGRGFADVLMGQAKPESVIQRTGIPNLDLVATGPFPPNPAELMMRGEFNSFLDYAKRAYDRVIFDCPPVMAVSEAATLASLVDGAILVVWAGQTSRKLSQLTLQIIRQRGARLIGCVLNNLEFGRVGYYYYSTYYGYYDYNYRYDRDRDKPGPSVRH